jgi:diphthamide synthase (EF-2-diphthine--ammonia ligase)
MQAVCVVALTYCTKDNGRNMHRLLAQDKQVTYGDWKQFQAGYIRGAIYSEQQMPWLQKLCRAQQNG